MPNTGCSSREQLRDYVVGKLPLAAAEAVMTHLDQCPECLAILPTLGDADETLIVAIRSPVPEDPFAGEPERKEFLSRVRNMFTASGRKSGQEPATEQELPGDLGEYQLLEKLGEGGMGAVYKALHTELHRVVALKMLPGRHTGDQRAMIRFKREIKAIGQLNHSNIVEAHDAREIGGTRFLVMEYVDGVDLGKLVRRRRPTADFRGLRTRATGGRWSAGCP